MNNFLVNTAAPCNDFNLAVRGAAQCLGSRTGRRDPFRARISRMCKKNKFMRIIIRATISCIIVTRSYYWAVKDLGAGECACRLARAQAEEV